MDNVEGTRGGIEVFKVKSHHNVSVSWYFGNKQINRCAYRLAFHVIIFFLFLKFINFLIVSFSSDFLLMVKIFQLRELLS